jgi:WXG100 family type VII secretion target
MTEQLQINHHEIMTQAGKLTTLKGELTTTLENCNTQIKSLLESGFFTGKSGTSFQATYTEWHVSAQRTVALMEQFGLHLKKTSDAFGSTDNEFQIKM